MQPIRIYPPFRSRSAFSLSLHGDSVFADFDVDEDRRVFLVRMSFDGYGCCDTAGTETMGESDSQRLLEMINRHAAAVDYSFRKREYSPKSEESFEVSGEASEEFERMLRAYFQKNKHVIPHDALDGHSLL